MFMLYAVLIGLIAGLAAGGRFAGLAAVRLRFAWAIMVGLFIQVALFTTPLGQTELALSVGPLIYIATVVLILGALIPDARGMGARLLAVGGACNLLVIVANSGKMPVSGEVLRQFRGDAAVQELLDGRVLTNVQLITERTWFPFLGDLFPTPGFIPHGNIFSVGDVIAGFGIILWIVTCMRGAVDRPEPERSAVSGVPQW